MVGAADWNFNASFFRSGSYNIIWALPYLKRPSRLRLLWLAGLQIGSDALEMDGITESSEEQKMLFL